MPLPSCYIFSTVTSAKLYPWTALILLTALNLLNYVDRSVLFAVQPLVQSEFHLSNTQVGYLTSAFLLFYMVAAPFVGPLADRYSRKRIIVGGAIFWSGLTLLTAVTHTYTELLVRHTLVGGGEATFVTIAPTFVADLFALLRRHVLEIEFSRADFRALLIRTGANPLERKSSAKLDASTLSFSAFDASDQLPSWGD